MLQVHGFDFSAIPKGTSSTNVTVEVSVRRHPTLVDASSSSFSAALHWQFFMPGYFTPFVKSAPVVDATRHIVRFTFDSRGTTPLVLRSAFLQDCRFGGNLVVESTNAVIEVDAVSIAVAYTGPLTLSAPPRRVVPAAMAPAASFVDHVVELRPTERIVPPLPFRVSREANGDLITSSWFTQADDGGDLAFGYFETIMIPSVPAFAFTMNDGGFEGAPERRSEPLELGGFEPVSARDSLLWPPPVSANSSAKIVGVQVLFRRGLQWVSPKHSVLDDVRRVALVWNANTSAAREFVLPPATACVNNAQAVWQTRRDSDASFGALDATAASAFADLAGTDVSELGADAAAACSQLRVRLGVRFDVSREQPRAVKNVWMRNAISNVRLRIKYRIDAAVPMRSATVPAVATLELPPTVVLSGATAEQSAVFAMEDAALMMAIDTTQLAPGSTMSVVVGGFGFARLPLASLVRGVRLNVAHALFRTWRCGDNQRHYACFDEIRWTGVELLDGATLLATASDVATCANVKREWPSDNCRRKGVCMADAVFRVWSRVPTPTELASAQLAVRLTFARARFSQVDLNAIEYGNAQVSAETRNGLEFTSLYHPRYDGVVVQGNNVVAGIGGVTLAVDYDPIVPDEVTRFSSGWLAGSIVVRGAAPPQSTITPSRAVVLDAADLTVVFDGLAEAVPDDVKLIGLEARWKRVNRCQAYPVTAPPTPAPTPTLTPDRLGALGSYAPVLENLKTEQEQLCLRSANGIGTDTVRCGYADVTLATSRCGNMYDRNYSFAGGAISDQLGAFSGNARPFPADYRAPARTFAVGGADYVWTTNASVTTTALLRVPELRVVAERPLVQPTRASAVLSDFEVRVHFASSALAPSTPDSCFFRLRADGTSRVAVDDLEWPATGSLALWFRTRGGNVLAPDRATLAAFDSANGGGSLALQVTRRAVELIAAPDPTANSTVRATVLASVALVSATDDSPLFGEREWVPLHLSWQGDNDTCLFVGRGARERRACVAAAANSSAADATARRGQLLVGAAPVWLERNESQLAIDIDSVAVFATVATVLRRERDWLDLRGESDVLFAHTFAESTGSCTCGSGVFASAFGRARRPIAVRNLDCNDPRCRIAQPIAPGRAFEASRDRLRTASVSLALDELRRALTACAEFDAPVDEPTQLAHWYRVDGTGELMTASTCAQTVLDTRILVLQTATANCSTFTCVASNDDAIRGAAACANGGSEVSWRSRAGDSYVVAVLTRGGGAAADAALPSFVLKLSSCERFTCGFARSCEPCAWRAAGGTIPQRVRLTASANLAAEERCVEPECSGSQTLQFAGVPQQETVLSRAAPSAAPSASVLRSNVRVTFRALHFAPATFVEPDFGAALGNDNDAFLVSAPWPGFAPADAEYVLRSFCANPIPTAYRVSMVDKVLPSERIATNVTCEPRAENATSDETVVRVDTACDHLLYRTTRVRCAASAVPALPEALREPGRALAVCRPDAELPVLRALLAGSNNSLLLDLIERAAKEDAPIDCNFPPFADELESNCSAAATNSARGKSVGETLQQLADSVASGGASLSALETDIVAAAKCDARRRELEFRKKAAVALNPFDCHQCASGGGVAVRLEPVFDAANAVLCLLERRLPTELHALVAVEVDGRLVFNETLRVASDGAVGARGERVQFARVRLAGDEIDPPERILLAATRAATFEYMTAPRSWVPFLTNARSWANDSCLHEPASLAAAGALDRTRTPLESFALLDSGSRNLVVDLLAKQQQQQLLANSSALPRNVSNAWQFAPPSAVTNGVRRAAVTFDMSGRLLLGLAPRGKVDESSVVARVRLQSSNSTDTVTLSVAGRLLNDFNKTGAAYVFEVAVRDPLARVYGRWDVLQVESDRFEIDIELDFARAAPATGAPVAPEASRDSMVATLMAMLGAGAASSMTLSAADAAADPAAANTSSLTQTYADALRIEISDSLSTFAVQANAEEVDLSLYAAEQAAVKAEIDSRLIPVLVFIGAVPLVGALLVAMGRCIQRNAPIPDEDTRLHRRHCIVIAFYIALRVARSLLLTLTFFSIVLQLVVLEPMTTLRTLPVWLDSVSNVSTAIVLRSDVALSVELDRQTSLQVQQQQACTLLLEQNDRDARNNRFAIERAHARAKDQRDISGLQQRHAAIQQQAIREAAQAQNAEQQQQTFCWKAFSASLFKTAELYAVDVGKLTAARFGELDAKFNRIVLTQIRPFEADLKVYVANVNGFVAASLRLTSLIDGFIGGISDAIEFFGIDVPDFRVLPAPPVAVSFPAVDWTFPHALPDWKVEMLLPTCNCPRDPGEFDVAQVGNEVAPGRNYTAFGPSEPAAEDDGSVPVPLPRVELRSFVSVPALVNVLGFLPDLTTLFSLTVVIDILLMVFTHIRTVKVVVQLVHGYRFDDEVIDVEASDEVQSMFGKNVIAGCCACMYRMVDRCNWLLQHYRSLALVIFLYASQVLTAVVGIVIFVLGVWLLVQLIAAVFTVQGFDGLGVFALIASPVTLALGQANVRAIENARQLNQQTLPANAISFLSAQQRIADATNEFNDAQQRDLQLFNSEYCALLASVEPALECDPVVQLFAEFNGTLCPHYRAIVPQLFADVDREQYATIVRASLTPYIDATRRLLTDVVWLVCSVIVIVMTLAFFSTLLYRALVWARMIRRRKRLIFESERALHKHADDLKQKERANEHVVLSMPARGGAGEFTSMAERQSWAERPPSERRSRRSRRRVALNDAGVPLPPAPLGHSASSRRRRAAAGDSARRANSQPIRTQPIRMAGDDDDAPPPDAPMSRSPQTL